MVTSQICISAVFFINLHQIRFINLVENLDQDISWHNLRKVRTNYLSNESLQRSSCEYLVSNEIINENIELFMDLVNASSSNHHPRNLTKDVINRGAKMFLYLNTCSKTSTKNNFNNFFKPVFEKSRYQYSTNSGIILYTLSALKLFSYDGRIIASKILEKISTLFELSLIHSQKNHIILEDTKSTFNIVYVVIAPF